MKREALSDLSKARELEDLRYVEALQRLNEEERERVGNMNADLARRGFSLSGAQLTGEQDLRIDKLGAATDAKIEIRRTLAASFPDLGNEHELNELLGEMLETLDHAEMPCQSAKGAVQFALKQQFDQDIYRLKSKARLAIEILKRELALKIPNSSPPCPTTIHVTTGGGPAVVNLGTIYGDVRQEIGRLDDPAHRELARVLQQLAEAIRDQDQLADARAEYLEQVRFIAQQAVEPAAQRKASVVKGLLAGLRARLHEAANVAQILAVAGPAIAHHFGFTWPA